MKVILKEDINNIGKSGDIIEVAAGYARNFLIPQGKVLEANKGNMKVFEEYKQTQEKSRQKEKQQAQELAKRIEHVSCTIVMQAQEEQLYGAVTNADIAKSLSQEGIDIDKKNILLEEPIKNLGVYQVDVKLHPEIKAQVKVWVVKK
ncbi:MAG: 50S ribosomal protein L9 [Candidatus Omnitrophica bacterium]|nr:50S ribosomal protein L9 [Candidatus Omnitrophota bacterium]MBU2063706.1 50S ribosomal protein L9 [Candidatus Omnitrophota bacterium]